MTKKNDPEIQEDWLLFSITPRYISYLSCPLIPGCKILTATGCSFRLTYALTFLSVSSIFNVFSEIILCHVKCLQLDIVKLIFFVYLPMKLINEPNFKYSITATRFTTYYTFIYIRIKNYGSIRAFIFRMTGSFVEVWSEACVVIC